MGTLQSKVNSAIDSKNECKNAIIRKMQIITEETPLDEYADKILNIDGQKQFDLLNNTDKNLWRIRYTLNIPEKINNTPITAVSLDGYLGGESVKVPFNQILAACENFSLPDTCTTFNVGTTPVIAYNCNSINVNMISQDSLFSMGDIFNNFLYFRYAGEEITMPTESRFFPWNYPRNNGVIDLPKLKILSLNNKPFCSNNDHVYKYTVYLPKITKITHTVNTGGLIHIPLIYFGGDLESIDAMTADVLRANGASSNSIPKGKSTTKTTFDNNNIPYTQREI